MARPGRPNKRDKTLDLCGRGQESAFVVGARGGNASPKSAPSVVRGNKPISAWTPEEEAAFARLMKVGPLERLPAIRLYRRCRGNLDRALRIAEAGRPTPGELARRAAAGARLRTPCADHRIRRAERGSREFQRDHRI